MTSKSSTLDDIQVSEPLTVDKNWSFYHNDERITYEQYLANEKAHKEWVAALVKSTEADEEPTKRKKRKND